MPNVAQIVVRPNVIEYAPDIHVVQMEQVITVVESLRVIAVNGEATNKLQTIVTAGVSLGGGRVVVIDSGLAQYASKDTADNATRVLGITTGAITSGNQGNVQTFGVMEDSAFSFTPMLPIYLSTNGLMTQAVPTSGFTLQVAFAETTTQIFIDIKEPNILI